MGKRKYTPSGNVKMGKSTVVVRCNSGGNRRIGQACGEVYFELRIEIPLIKKVANDTGYINHHSYEIERFAFSAPLPKSLRKFKHMVYQHAMSRWLEHTPIQELRAQAYRKNGCTSCGFCLKCVLRAHLNRVCEGADKLGASQLLAYYKVNLKIQDSIAPSKRTYAEKKAFIADLYGGMPTLNEEYLGTFVPKGVMGI